MDTPYLNFKSTKNKPLDSKADDERKINNVTDVLNNDDGGQTSMLVRVIIEFYSCNFTFETKFHSNFVKERTFSSYTKY
jgi:hypothetical protein